MATVRFGDEYSEFFPIKRGVWQGCVLSAKPFNVFTEKIFNESDELLAVLLVERILTT